MAFKPNRHITKLSTLYAMPHHTGRTETIYLPTHKAQTRTIAEQSDNKLGGWGDGGMVVQRCGKTRQGDKRQAGKHPYHKPFRKFAKNVL